MTIRPARGATAFRVDDTPGRRTCRCDRAPDRRRAWLRVRIPPARVRTGSISYRSVARVLRNDSLVRQALLLFLVPITFIVHDFWTLERAEHGSFVVVEIPPLCV